MGSFSAQSWSIERGTVASEIGPKLTRESRTAYAKGCSGEPFVRLLADDARRIVDVA
jgi:hypothetical protein